MHREYGGPITAQQLNDLHDNLGRMYRGGHQAQQPVSLVSDLHISGGEDKFYDEHYEHMSCTYHDFRLADI